MIDTHTHTTVAKDVAIEPLCSTAVEWGMGVQGA